MKSILFLCFFACIFAFNMDAAVEHLIKNAQKNQFINLLDMLQMHFNMVLNSKNKVGHINKEPTVF